MAFALQGLLHVSGAAGITQSNQRNEQRGWVVIGECLNVGLASLWTSVALILKRDDDGLE